MGDGSRSARSRGYQQHRSPGTDDGRRNHAAPSRFGNDYTRPVAARTFRCGSGATGSGGSGIYVALWRAIQNECGEGAAPATRKSAAQNAALAAATEVT